MERQHRRLSPTARTYRHTKVPAYKVKRAARPADAQPEEAPESNGTGTPTAAEFDALATVAPPLAESIAQPVEQPAGAEPQPQHGDDGEERFDPLATVAPAPQITAPPDSIEGDDASAEFDPLDTVIPLAATFHPEDLQTDDAAPDLPVPAVPVVALNDETGDLGVLPVVLPVLAAGADAQLQGNVPDVLDVSTDSAIDPETGELVVAGDGILIDDTATPDGVASQTTTDPHGTTQNLDYTGYLESIEAAAARSRAELRGRSVPRMRPAAVAAPAAVATVPLMQAPALAAPAAGDGAPPQAPPTQRQRGRGDGKRKRRRPPTWVLVAAMIPLVLGIGFLIYAANLAKTTFDAYNDIHVEPTERPRFQVNAEGTPEIIPTEQVEAILPDWDEKDKVNILLLGIDPRPDDEEPPRSDTIIIVNIDPAEGTVTMMSVPRDLWVYIPGFDEDKVNAAYPLGEANQDIVPGGGPSLVAQTIEANFGIPIHYFATVDFDGFRKIVDTIGGVIIDVPAPVKDDQYPTENYGLTRVYFHTGLQKMDGETALRYARTRHGDNDISRGDRQQQVLQAIRAQSMSLGLITQANELISEVGDSVRTDLNFNQLLALANLGRNIDSANIRTVNLWDMGLLYEHDPEFEGDAFYFEGDWNGIHLVMADLFAVEPPPTPTPEPTATAEATATPPPTDTAIAATPTATNEVAPAVATDTTVPEATPTTAGPTTPVPGPGVDFALPIVVQNSSGIDLLATDSVALLANIGFSEVYADSTDVPIATTAIYDNIGSPDTARYIADLLGLPPSVIQPSNGGTAILVVLGQDVPLDVLRP